MPLIKINWNPDNKQLRRFGLAALIATFLISLLLYFVKGISVSWAAALFICGFIIFLSSRFSIRLTKVFYQVLTAVTMPIGFVISFILLTVFYFVLIMPLGLLFGLLGRDPLYRKFDRNAESYWIAHREPEQIERYFRQF